MDILENSSWSLSKEILSITPQQSEHLSFSLHLTPLKLTACTWNYGWLVDEVSFCDGFSSGASGEMFVFGCVFSSMAFFVGNLWFFGHVWFQSTCRTCLWSQKHISWRDDEIPSTPPAPWWQLWQHRKHFTLQDSCALYSPVNLQECWTGLPRFHKSRASRRTGAPEFWMPCRALESLQGLQDHLPPHIQDLMDSILPGAAEEANTMTKSLGTIYAEYRRDYSTSREYVHLSKTTSTKRPMWTYRIHGTSIFTYIWWISIGKCR